MWDQKLNRWTQPPRWLELAQFQPCRIQTVPALASVSLPCCHKVRSLLACCHLPSPKVTLPSACLLQNYTSTQPLSIHPAQGQPSQPRAPSCFAEPSALPQAPSHSEVPLKKYIPEYKTVTLCQGAALGSGVPCHGPIFGARTPRAGTHARTRAAWGCYCIWAPGRSQRGEGPAVPGGGRGKLTKQRCSGSTCSGFFEEELAVRGSRVNLLFARGARREVRCLPHTPGSGTKLIYTQLEPSKHYTADQTKMSVTTAFDVLPCLKSSGPPLFSGKTRGWKQLAL